jgi:hypothetical protein
VSSSGVQLKLAAGYQGCRLLEQPRAVEAVAAAGDDQGFRLDGVLAGGEVKAVLGVDGGDQVGRRGWPGITRCAAAQPTARARVRNPAGVMPPATTAAA